MIEEEAAEKILLFSNPDQREVEQKKKFVELWKERSRNIVLTQCCTAGGEVEITRIRPSAIAKGNTGQVNCTVLRKHSCMSSPFPIAILNGTFLFCETT